MPWLFSMTMHALLIALLGASLRWTEPRHGGPSEGLHTVFISSGPGGDGGLDDVEQSAYGTPDANDGGRRSQQPGTDQSDLSAAAVNSLMRENPATLRALLGQLPAPNPKTVQLASGAADEPQEAAPSDAKEGAERGVRHGSPAPTGLRPGYARTTVFGVTGEGQKFLYVFDRSGSMDGHGGTPLAAAKAELIASLEDLSQTNQFQIIFYNEQPRVFNPSGSPGRLVFGNEQNKSLARKFIGSMTAAGATRHEEALDMALRMGPDVIFFLTDADEPRMTSQQLARIANRNRGTTINTIEFGYGEPSGGHNFLMDLAKQNNGQHAYVDVSKLPAPKK